MLFLWILIMRFHAVTNHQFDLPVDLDTCVRQQNNCVFIQHKFIPNTYLCLVPLYGGLGRYRAQEIIREFSLVPKLGATENLRSS